MIKQYPPRSGPNWKPVPEGFKDRSRTSWIRIPLWVGIDSPEFRPSLFITAHLQFFASNTLAIAILIPTLTAYAGGAGIDSRKVAMVAPVKLDTVKAWKNFQGLYDSIGKASTASRLDELSEKRDFVAESLEEIFPERSLAISVSRLLINRLNSRRQAIRPKPGRQPKPDLWKEVALQYNSLRLRYEIVSGFQRHGFRSELTDGFESKFPESVERLKTDLSKAESKSPEPFPFPEEGLVVKGTPPNPKKKSDEIRELTGLITESLRAWSGNP